MDRGFLFRVIKIIWDWIVVILAYFANILKPLNHTL